METFGRGMAHVLHPDRDFDFRAMQRTSVLVVNFFVDDIDDHACRLGGGSDLRPDPVSFPLSLSTPAGAGLSRYLSFVWGELTRGGGVLRSGLVAREIEDGLIAAFVAALQAGEGTGGPEGDGCDDRRIVRAEEYLLAHLLEPVSRDALAAYAGLSIRSLSRGFRKRHGVGPMAFLRRCRMEAVRADLLEAEPRETSVSEIAVRYGFSELGKFSAAYKALFGETPSETLRR